MAQSDDPMAEIRASFFIECEELLESLQDAMAVMADTLAEGGAQDPETINIAFRAVHSIKGGAGAFGLNALVTFAHRFETVMDEVRAGRLAIDPGGMKLFFSAADMLADQVRLAGSDPGASPEGAPALLTELEALIGGVAEEAPEEAADFTPMLLSLDLGQDPAVPALPEGAEDLHASSDPGGSPPPDGPSPESAAGDLPQPWLIAFAPHSAMYASGNEALHILRALALLASGTGSGEATIHCNRQKLSPLAEMDPELSALSWKITLPGTVAEEDIREIFDFVEDLAVIEIARAEAGQCPTGPGVSDPALPEAPPGPPSASTAAPDAGSDAFSTADPPVAEHSAQATPDTGTATPTATVTAAPATAPLTPLRGAGDSPKPAGDPVSATVRVDLDRIDRLVNLVGELVINQAMLAQSVVEAGLPANSAVMSGLEAFMMLTRDIQDSVMMIRAQPVKPLFQRMGRIVREASGAVGKEVRLHTEGEGTEVDKTVIERLSDPLTHMIRNAVDHGLERPEDRLAAGKPREGHITLSAQHRSGRVVIEIIDDGAGINRPKVRDIAISRGLIPPEATLSDAEIDNLLFLPGFSTASQISALSGRGVGMDVVKQAIQALGGRIAITSEPGRGTCFSISLPLTLAVLDGMVVRVAGETLVVPLSSIVETATLTRPEIRMLGPETSVIHIRGGFVPLFDLGAELGYRMPLADYAGCIVLLTARDDGSRAALVVEEIMEQRQVVIKGLQQGYGHIPGVAAATILGDGQIALILDPGDLVQNASGRTRSADPYSTLSMAG